MYRSSDYEKMAQLVYEVYKERNITSFPVDVIDLAKRMGFSCVPYSSYSEVTRRKLIGCQPYGFHLFTIEDGNPKYLILYNDFLPRGNWRITIGHEIKHILCQDGSHPSKKDEDLATFFGKILIAPMPAIIHLRTFSVFEIQSTFDVSYEVAEYLWQSAQNRILKSGEEIYSNERSFIKHLFKTDRAK